jgi:hypothetical protein
VESIPGWVGKIHGLKVPKGVIPFTRPIPGGNANIKIILTLAGSVLHLEGDLAECGVYRGGTIIPLGLYLEQHNVKKAIFGFDSFEGFGDNVSLIEDTSSETRRLFTDTSYEMVTAKISDLNLSNRITIIKGFFSESTAIVKDRRFCFVHLDCDLYESYKFCLNFFYNRMIPGGIILFDEYNDPPWPGCNRAIDEFLIDKPEKVMEICSDNYVRYYIRKRPNEGL